MRQSRKTRRSRAWCFVPWSVQNWVQDWIQMSDRYKLFRNWQPSDSSHLHIFHVTVHNHFFGLSTGHVMKGEKRRTCEKQGYWSGSPPQCKYVDCGEYTVSSLENGHVERPDRTDYGASFNFTCHPNYTITGSTQVVCRESGWEGKRPECLYSICPPPTPIINGTARPISTRYSINCVCLSTVWFCKD